MGVITDSACVPTTRQQRAQRGFPFIIIIIIIIIIIFSTPGSKDPGG